MQKDNILKLWGKADKDNAGKVIWHPLAYHMLDVAESYSLSTTCGKDTRHSEMPHRKDLINQVLTISPLAQLVQGQSMKKESLRG